MKCHLVQDHSNTLCNCYIAFMLYNEMDRNHDIHEARWPLHFNAHADFNFFFNVNSHNIAFFCYHSASHRETTCFQFSTHCSYTLLEKAVWPSCRVEERAIFYYHYSHTIYSVHYEFATSAHVHAHTRQFCCGNVV